jgi:hypothetical protein
MRLDFCGGMDYFSSNRSVDLMNRLICRAAALASLLAGGFIPSARAQNLDQIGVTILRAVTTNLDGSGIHVAQPEANTDSNTNHPSAFEVNPATVNQPTSRFAYTSAAGTTNTFPNFVGNESGHADGVAGNFYGLSGGVATNVAHVDNFDADYFIGNYIISNLTVLDAVVVNQSFTWGALAATNQQAVDSAYDDYSGTYGTLFVSAACNASISLKVCAPGTAYNCISVAAYGGDSSIGPTIDNGRCKPDITAPAGVTSYSTPQVSGAAAVLMQAALRGDGGGDTNAAFDLRTIKALLLNGAVKPVDWTNSNSSPLDARYGAGVLNVFNSYEQLAGGKQSFCTSNSVASGTAHPPVTNTNSMAAGSGWDFEDLSSDATNDPANHYFFNVSNGMATATLVWNRQLGATNINDLDLFLYDCASSNLVACSTSRVDNVEHLFVPKLAAGRYDLQVLKNGGTNVVTAAETYALAWAFVSPALSLAKSGTNAALTWLVYPAGFRVETTTNLTAPAWITNNLSPSVVTNSRNSLNLNPTNALRFFRLRQPNF